MDNTTSTIEPEISYKIFPVEELDDYYDGIRNIVKKMIEERAEKNFNDISKKYFGE